MCVCQFCGMVTGSRCRGLTSSLETSSKSSADISFPLISACSLQGDDDDDLVRFLCFLFVVFGFQYRCN